MYQTLYYPLQIHDLDKYLFDKKNTCSKAESEIQYFMNKINEDKETLISSNFNQSIGQKNVQHFLG